MLIQHKLIYYLQSHFLTSAHFCHVVILATLLFTVSKIVENDTFAKVNPAQHNLLHVFTVIFSDTSPLLPCRCYSTLIYTDPKTVEKGTFHNAFPTKSNLYFSAKLFRLSSFSSKPITLNTWEWSSWQHNCLHSLFYFCKKKQWRCWFSHHGYTHLSTYKHWEWLLWQCSCSHSLFSLCKKEQWRCLLVVMATQLLKYKHWERVVMATQQFTLIAYPSQTEKTKMPVKESFAISS